MPSNLTSCHKEAKSPIECCWLKVAFKLIGSLNRFTLFLGSILILQFSSSTVNAQETSSSSSEIETVHELDQAAKCFTSYYFSRDVEYFCVGTSSIDFKYPTRPTVHVRFGGVEHLMLLDTGTYCCIINAIDENILPPGTTICGNQEYLAELESKLLIGKEGLKLTYGVVDSMSLGDFRFRNLPVRFYQSESADRVGVGGSWDFDGAIAPVVFGDRVIEVDNVACVLRFHDPSEFIPPVGCNMLPILRLPRGLFIPLTIGGQTYWFHLDTGFSGTLGVLPTTVSSHPDSFAFSTEAEVYQTWNGSSTYASGVLSSLEINPYQALTWANSEKLVLNQVEAVSYPDVYGELHDYNIGGVVGSGFLSRFHYWLDIAQCRFYLLPD